MSHTTHHPERPNVVHAAFSLRGVHCLGCAGAVERGLREQPHITEVRLDWKSDVVHEYHGGHEHHEH